jgi:hypothetical protein
VDKTIGAFVGEHSNARPQIFLAASNLFLNSHLAPGLPPQKSEKRRTDCH